MRSLYNVKRFELKKNYYNYQLVLFYLPLDQYYRTPEIQTYNLNFLHKPFPSAFFPIQN